LDSACQSHLPYLRLYWSRKGYDGGNGLPISPHEGKHKSRAQHRGYDLFSPASSAILEAAAQVQAVVAAVQARGRRWEPEVSSLPCSSSGKALSHLHPADGQNLCHLVLGWLGINEFVKKHPSCRPDLVLEQEHGIGG